MQTCPQVYSGAGFVFSERDPYAGIDLDNAAKKLAERADKAKAAGRPIDEAKIAAMQEDWRKQQQLIFEKFNSYTEISPSGKGSHIIIRLTDKRKLWQGRKQNAVELYCQCRFFTMTGNIYHKVPIAERQALAEILWAELGNGTDNNAKISYYDNDERCTDSEVITFGLNAVNGDKFARLLEGSWEGLHPSQSEADLAFMNMIVFYSRNRNQSARIFRNSPLGKRPKAQRANYMQWLLDKAGDRLLPPVDISGLVNPFLKGEVK